MQIVGIASGVHQGKYRVCLLLDWAFTWMITEYVSLLRTVVLVAFTCKFANFERYLYLSFDLISFENKKGFAKFRTVSKVAVLIFSIY